MSDFRSADRTKGPRGQQGASLTLRRKLSIAALVLTILLAMTMWLALLGWGTMEVVLTAMSAVEKIWTSAF
ncbi:hypothetical protein ACQR0Z_27675 [Bradyrhizobium sp. HKCCYLS3077]|uniref:hypothetical protein n=1 Tax=unclassified Bradyrhizobium TaxID=2631580 RepID=UPI003EBBE0BC